MRTEGKPCWWNARIERKKTSVVAITLLIVASGLWTGAASRAVERPAVNKTPAEPSSDSAVVVNSIGMKLRRIAAGRFWMGSRDDDPDAREDEKPRHRVTISRPFYLGVYEVTQDEWARVLGQRKSFFRPDGAGADKVGKQDTGRFPAEQVTWVDAVAFCRRLTALPAEKKAGRSYRLPSEAEWEYAARAGTQTAFAFGDRLSSRQANFNGRYPFGGAAKGPFLSRTTRVGSYAPNAFGLFDMHGNVWEWCGDRYGRTYYRTSPAKDPTGPASGSRRVIRGGDWYSDGRDCRSAFRYADVPDGTFYALGLRVVMVKGDARPVLAPPPQAAKRRPQLAEGTRLATTGESWPQWRGPRSNGTWHGPPLPQRWPAQGLRRFWRQPLGGGYGGISVADGRAYVMDRVKTPEERERLQCFDAASGRLLWSREQSVDYNNLPYGNGPRTTPTVQGGRVYALGALGHLACREAATGKPLWTIDLVRKYAARVPLWGVSASPVLYRDLVIVQVGSERHGCLMAFRKETGERVWGTLTDPAGYATPIVIPATTGRPEQLVCWTPTHVRSVDPASGKLLWSTPFVVNYGTSIAMPLFAEGLVIVSGYYDGSKAIRWTGGSAAPTVVWQDKRNLRGLMAQPLARNGLGYLLDKRHGLTCFDIATGRKLWDDENRMTPKGRNPQATLVWLGDTNRVLILNSDGELILARLTARGYEEASRTKIVGETWAHPAYAKDRVFARSDAEIVCYSLREPAPR